jgi:hypothetical protein
MAAAAGPASFLGVSLATLLLCQALVPGLLLLLLLLRTAVTFRSLLLLLLVALIRNPQSLTGHALPLLWC